MYNHEPSNDFVERLEQQIGHELRRRQRSQVSLWSPKMTLAASALAVVSMGIGAAATAAAYQAKSNSTRDLIVSSLEQRRDLARRSYEIAVTREEDSRRGISTGAADPEKIAEAQARLAEATAQFEIADSLLDEARKTGLIPSDQLSAPLVSGHDFVLERLGLQQPALDANYDLAQMQYENKQKMMSIGAGNPLDVETAKVHRDEVAAGVQIVKRRIKIRHEFRDRHMDAAQAELRNIECDAELRRMTIEPQLELARKQLESVSAQVRIGAAGPVQEAEAKLKVQQLESDIAKADLDLALVRQRLNSPKR